VIAKGEPWGEPTVAAPDLTVEGSDADLAVAVADRPGALVRFVPRGSDLAAALGLAASADSASDPAPDPATGSAPDPGAGGLALPLDLVAIDDGPPAANLVVVGTPPPRLRATSRSRMLTVEVDGRALFAGRAGAVVVANGQFLDGVDLVPRGHPGDGRIEVHVYALRRSQRAAMRHRLPQGNHLPHPRIVTGTARQFAVTGSAPLPWVVDGRPQPPRARIAGHVQPGAYRILIRAAPDR